MATGFKLLVQLALFHSSPSFEKGQKINRSLNATQSKVLRLSDSLNKASRACALTLASYNAACLFLSLALLQSFSYFPIPFLLHEAECASHINQISQKVKLEIN